MGRSMGKKYIFLVSAWCGRARTTEGVTTVRQVVPGIKKKVWQATGSKPVDVIPLRPLLHSVPASSVLDDWWRYESVREIDLLLPVIGFTTEREPTNKELLPLPPGTMKS